MKRQSPINIEMDDAIRDEHLEDIDIRQPDEDDMDKRMYFYNDGHSGNPNNAPMAHHWELNSPSTKPPKNLRGASEILLMPKKCSFCLPRSRRVSPKYPKISRKVLKVLNQIKNTDLWVSSKSP